jgi:RHS repeat-associated protein
MNKKTTKRAHKIISTIVLTIFFISNLGLRPALADKEDISGKADFKNNNIDISKKADSREIVDNTSFVADSQPQIDNKEIDNLRNENSDFNSLEGKINNIAKVEGVRGDFSVDKFSGASTYSYGIELPAARTLTPDINIYYNSLNNKYSFLGDGWNLSMSYIGFRPKLGIDNMYSDNEFEISFQGSQEKLINTGGNEYVLEKEGSFLNIEKLDNYWLITDKEGIKYYFGNTTDSKQINNSLNQTYRWYLSKAEDVNYNYVSYEYFHDHQAIYPKTIIYTSYLDQLGDKEIRFQPYYNQNLIGEKNIIDFTGGFEQKIDYLLQSIEVIVHSYNEEPIYYYNFNYDNNKLTGIQEIGQDIDGNILSYPETFFEYYDNDRSFYEDSNSSLPDDLNFSYIINNQIYENNEIRWFDINGDGSEDIIKSIELNNEIFSEVYLNDQGNFELVDIEIPLPFVKYANYNNYPNGTINQALEIFDINGDNLQDLVQSYEYQNQIYSNIYLNNGDGFNLANYPTLPIAFTLNDQGNFDKYYDYKIFDINGDNLQDLVQSYEYQNQIYSNIYLNNGDGEFIESDYYDLPLAFEFRNNQDRLLLFSVKTLDINNDGLLDLVRSLNVNNTDIQEIYLNNGDGGFSLNEELEIPVIFASMDDTIEKNNHKLRIIDINNDGLFDFNSSYYINGQNYQEIYLNNGKGEFIETDEIEIDFVFAEYNGSEFVRKNNTFNVDLNHDGNIDFLKNYQTDFGEVYYLASLADYKASNKLKKITSSLGLETLIKYQSSSYYLDENNNNSNDSLPFIYDVVNEINIINDDQINKEFYHYAQGAFLYHDVYNREFVGFGIVTTLDNEEDKYVKEYYHQGGSFDGSEIGEFEDNKYKKGKLYRSEVYAMLDGENFEKVSETQNKWESQFINNDSAFIYLDTSLSLKNESDESLMKAGKYVYDDHGNLITEINYGTVVNNFDYNINDLGIDKYTIQIDYAGGEIQKPYQIEKLNYYNSFMTRSRYYYDNLALGNIQDGLLTEDSNWINNTNEWFSNEYDYNDRGNLVSSTNSLGNSLYYNYDETGDYKINESNSLGHVNNYTYNKLTGNIKGTINANGFENIKEFDPLGRIVRVKNSKDSYNQTYIITNKIEYSIGDLGLEVILEENSNPAGFFPIKTKYFYNKLNQLVQIKKETSSGILTYSIKYLPSGNMEYKTIPYLSDDLLFSEPPEEVNLYINYSYDALDRLISEENALGLVRKEYFLLAQNEYDLEDNKVRKEYDESGNLVSLIEYIDDREIMTSFNYNLDNQLISILDTNNNIRNFDVNNQNNYTYLEDLHFPEEENFNFKYREYDLLGRKILEFNELDNYNINYEYDELNRIIGKSETLNNTNYQLNYDEGNNALGKLTSIIGPNFNKYYYYNFSGNLIKERININNEEFITAYKYDDLQRLRAISYPNREVIYYEYDDYSNIFKINRGSQEEIVSDVKYNLLGQIKALLYGNGILQTYEYDSDQLYRLTNKKASRVDLFSPSINYLQNLSYAYSPNGNLVNLSNQNLNNYNESWGYEYDDLDRLVRAEKYEGLNQYSIEYEYDDLGNLLSKSDLGIYQYNSIHPHAVSQINNNQFNYDNRGNLVNQNNYQLDFDAYNRLSSSVSNDNEISYHYDFNNILIGKEINNNQFEYYINNLFQKNNSKETSYVFLQDQRVAKIVHSNSSSIEPDPRNGIFYYLTDHLGSTSVLLNRDGAVVEQIEYFPFGSSLVDTNESKSDYKYNAKLYENDLGLYYYGHRFYNSQIGRFISIDPLQDDIPSLINAVQNNSQYLNSYSYVNNNPVKYTDPDGDIAILAALAVAALVGAAVDASLEIGIQMYQNKSFDLTKINYKEVGKAAAIGAVVGLATFGAGKVFSAIKGANKVRKLTKLPLSKGAFNMLDDAKYAGRISKNSGAFNSATKSFKLKKGLTKVQKIATLNHEAIHYQDAKFFGILGKKSMTNGQAALSETRAYWDEVYKYGRKGLKGLYLSNRDEAVGFIKYLRNHGQIDQAAKYAKRFSKYYRK